MEPFELYNRVPYCPNTQPLIESNPYKRTDIWACGKCRVVHASFGKANDCCSTTETCTGCGLEKPKSTYCQHCADVREKKRMEKRLADSVFVTEYKWIFLEDEEYFSDTDAVQQFYEDLDDERFESIPRVGWDCDEMKFSQESIDIHEIMADKVRDGYHEDAEDELKGTKELQAHIDAWLEKQTITSYTPNFTRKIDLSKEYEAAKIERAKNV